MLLSRQYRFVFIHPPKTAGTSLKQALAPYADLYPLDLVEGTEIEDYVKKTFVLPNHFTLAQAERTLKLDMSGYLRIASVRNPWTRYASLYQFFRRIGSHPTSIFCNVHTFPQFMELLVRGIFPGDTRNQFAFLADSERRVRYDVLVRHEHLAADVQNLSDRLGIALNMEHIHRNPAPEKYAAMYNDRARQLVADYCAQEIETLRYRYPY